MEENQIPKAQLKLGKWTLIVGIIGVLLFINLIISVIKMLYRFTGLENSFVLLTYLIMVSFCIADNLIYFTHPLFIFCFMASFLSPGIARKTG